MELFVIILSKNYKLLNVSNMSGGNKIAMLSGN